MKKRVFKSGLFVVKNPWAQSEEPSEEGEDDEEWELPTKQLVNYQMRRSGRMCGCWMGPPGSEARRIWFKSSFSKASFLAAAKS